MSNCSENLGKLSLFVSGRIFQKNGIRQGMNIICPHLYIKVVF